MTGYLLRSLLVLAALLLWGCNLENRMMVRRMSSIARKAGAAVEEHWDYDLVGAAMPGNILQLEGIHRLDPGHEETTLRLMRAYGAYAFGWVEDQAEEARRAGREEQAEALDKRALALHRRAAHLGIALLEQRHKGAKEAFERGGDTWRRWLRDALDEREDVHLLLAFAQTWASIVNLSRDEPASIARFPAVKISVERAVELDPAAEHATGPVLLGAMEASSGSLGGGDLDKARAHFAKALALTRGEALMVRVQYARTYAVARGDAKLYTQTLQAVLGAKTQNPSLRLANTLAQRRARRYLSQRDELFP